MRNIWFTLLLTFALIGPATADLRIDEYGSHFVKPSGIEAGNNGDEIKELGCYGSIITNDDGTRTGSVICEREYAAGTIPFGADFEHTSDPNVTNIVCNLDDTNNTYSTKEWTVDYDLKVKDLEKFKRAFGTQEGDRKYDSDFDYNEDGVINMLDLSLFKAQAKGKAEYALACFNADRQ